jgi:hypothetical protein
MRIAAGGTPAFTVPAPPESLLQLAQWQTLSVSGGSSTSNRTPPQRQLPCKVVTVRAYTRRIARRDLLLLSVAAVLLAAAAYELAVALEWLSLGPQPGDEARGQAVVTIAAFTAILVAAVAGTLAARRGRVPGWVAALAPLAAVAYVITHFYAFDSYDLPSLRRFSDSGDGFSVWVYAVSACSLAVSALALVRPRWGLALTPFAVVACGVTVLLMGAGH